MRNWISLITETQSNTILITDLYSERDLTDESELISQYAPPIDWDNPLTIKVMPVDQIKTLLDIRERSILQSFRNATKDQRELVKYKIDNFDAERIVVLCDDTVIDGNHHVIAAIRASKPIRYVDLSEWD